MAENKYDGIVAAIAGMVGGGLTINFMQITWETAWQNLGQLLWVGFVAFFTGAMGVLGKHLISKYLKRKK